jgi:hypothetical protein
LTRQGVPAKLEPTISEGHVQVAFELRESEVALWRVQKKVVIFASSVASRVLNGWGAVLDVGSGIPWWRKFWFEIRLQVVKYSLRLLLPNPSMGSF